MINEPFEPISEPRACGWPYHGFAFTKQVGGVVTSGMIVNGVEVSTPPEFVGFPQGTRVAHKIRHPDAPLLDLSAEEIASEAAANRTWRNYATISGERQLFYGNNLEARSWIAILDDGKAWKVTITPSQIGLRQRWVMWFTRYSYGPAYIDGMAGTSHSFWVELAPFHEMSMFTPTSAEYNDVYKIRDISPSGDRVIVSSNTSFLAIRVIKSADLAPYEVTLETASGEIPFVFDCVIDRVVGVYNSPVNTTPIIKIDPLVEYVRDWDAASSALLPDAARTRYPSSTVRVYSTHPNWLSAFVDYKLYDMPPITISESYKLTIKAHFPEDGSDGFIMYVDETTYTATLTPSGQFCAFGGNSGGTGGSSNPLSQDYCVPPATCTGSIQHTVKQTITYAGVRYTGTSEWITAATNLNINFFGSPVYPVVNSLNGFAWVIPWPQNEAFTTPFAHFFNAPEPMAPDHQNASTASQWNAAYWDGNSETQNSIPVGRENTVSLVGRGLPGPITYCPDQSGLPYARFRPAAATMPKGLYYKGKFIKPWLPAHNVVWSVDPETYEVMVLQRPALYNGDGYTYCCYI